MGMGTMLTWDQMMAKTTVNRLHPEVLRRFKALIEFAYTVGIPLGVGTGWRVQPPHRPGFARPGNSWHESCPVSPASATALAIDTVPDISWNWLDTHCANFGLRTFKNVNNEPWHVQPAEISTSRKFATTLPNLVEWKLPTGPETAPPVEVPPARPIIILPRPPTRTTFTLQLQKTQLEPAKQAQLKGNGDVFLVQQIAQGWFRQSGNATLD